MANIGTWSVNIIANTFGFDRKLDKSRKKTTLFQRTLKSASRELRAFGAMALGAFGIGSVAAFTSAQLKQIDALGKSSDRLGLSTEKLSAYQMAARLSGVEIKALETGIQRMVRRVSQAAQGTGEAKDAIKELGFNARRLAMQNPAAQFEAIGNAIAKLPNPGDRIRLAQKLFDSEGVVLVNAFAAGLGKVEREYRRIGAVLTRDEVQKVEDLNDAFTRLQTTSAGAGQSLMVTLAPFLEEAAKGAQVLAEVIGQAAKKGRDPENSMASKIGRAVNKAYGVAGTAMSPYFMSAEDFDQLWHGTARKEVAAERRRQREANRARGFSDDIVEGQNISQEYLDFWRSRDGMGNPLPPVVAMPAAD